jgi:2-haloacid dehalogenase
VYSVGLLAEQLFPGAGDRLAQLWRDKQIEYTRLVSMSGTYQPFWTLTRSAAVQRREAGLAWPRGRGPADERVPAPVGLPGEPRGAAGAEGARRAAGILSNGDPEMLAIAVRSAGFGGLLDPVLSVHETRRFKTDPAAYRWAWTRTRLPAREILFVSSNGWDAIGATWFGFTTLWVNRAGGRWSAWAPADRIGTACATCSTFPRA